MSNKMLAYYDTNPNFFQVFHDHYDEFTAKWVRALRKIAKQKSFLKIAEGLKKFPRNSIYAITFVEGFLFKMEGVTDMKGALIDFLAPKEDDAIQLSEEERLFIEADEEWTKKLECWIRIFRILYGYKSK
jgi:hypothetical protein